ncbi:probable uridine nucleosidase 2 [Phragmites australis]|uniref:probable uridine nucleosidase 2 n=1 Tax=Phragmites australis TaxID=29695 RepID=UPI002D78B93C|nr:probable uridine nucleosidase 2 [Phragmites australis]
MEGNGQIHHHQEQKVIIDTDPGIDDSVAIMMAFQSPGVQVLGLTTIFGNCTTECATRNALILCEKAGHPEVPVAEGSPEPLKGGKPHVADFVHGSDGLGNIDLPDPTSKKVEQSAAEFLVDKVSQFPGEVSVLALGPLTNVALAIKRDSSFVSKVKRIVVLGGAFFSAGNATPSAEANIHSDPEAADIVFTSGADIYVVGLNITTQVSFTDDDLLELRNSKGKHAQFLCDICKFYRDWHVKSYGVPVVFLHDPVSFAALVHPEYFTFKKGVVRVETQGICTGHTSMDMLLKKWNSENPWTGYSPISVAWTVDVPKVVAFVKELVTKE